MSAEAASPPFAASSYDLAGGSHAAAVALQPLAPGEAGTLGAAFAAMDPWAAYGIAPERLARFFADREAGCFRAAIRHDDRLAGVVVVRHPWLHGPYLQFLGLLPGFQGHGLGAAVLTWMQVEAGSSTRNLWLCVSAINRRARAFYERHGFELAAALPALAADHMDELLMRKRLVAPQA